MVSSPARRILPTADGPRYVREVDLGRKIGSDKFNNFSQATKMTVLTDGAGNPTTDNAVVLDSSGNFVTGSKLSPGTQQFEDFIKKGVL